jgi:transposase-like protein
MKYGKITTTKSYFDDKLVKTTDEYSEPVLVTDKAQALNEAIKALELITSKVSNKVVIEVEADPITYHFKLITKKYIVKT